MAKTQISKVNTPTIYKTTKNAVKTFTTDFAVEPLIIHCTTTASVIVGSLVEFTTTGTLPAPLVINKLYSVITLSGTTDFEVSLDGVTSITLTSNGTGTQTFESYTTKIELKNFIMTKDEPEEKGFYYESVINGHTEWNEKGMHYVMELQLNLHKETTYATRLAYFKSLAALLYANVYFYRYIDAISAQLFRDASSDAVLFTMYKFELSYETQSEYKDILKIGFRSKDYVDLSKTL